MHKNHKKTQKTKTGRKIRKSLANPIPSKGKSKTNTIVNKKLENQKNIKKSKKTP